MVIADICDRRNQEKERKIISDASEQLVAQVVEARPLEHGSVLRLPLRTKAPGLAVEVILSKRVCRLFLRFDLSGLLAEGRCG